jgi:hypothetical protein
MLISTALLLDSNIRNSVCTPAKLPCRRVVEGSDIKQQKQAYILDIAVPNSPNITQTYNTKIKKYVDLSVAMRNLWCLEKKSILPIIISATGIVPQSFFKKLKILDLGNTLVVEIQKGILLYSCHIVRKFLNIDTEHKTQQSQNMETRRR